MTQRIGNYSSSPITVEQADGVQVTIPPGEIGAFDLQEGEELKFVDDDSPREQG